MFHFQVHIKVVHIEGILNSTKKLLIIHMARFEPTPLQGDRGLIHEPDKQLRPLGHALTRHLPSSILLYKLDT